MYHRLVCAIIGHKPGRILNIKARGRRRIHTMLCPRCAHFYTRDYLEPR